jgi:ABC-2 type transport system permease protein
MTVAVRSLARSGVKYWAIGRTQLIQGLAYPAELLARSLAILIFMWVFIHLWRATYQATGELAIAGMTLADTVWYLVLAETIVLSKPRLAGSIADTVKDGSIAYLLNKPYSFLLYHLSVGLGDSLVRMLANFAAGATLVWLAVGPPPGPRGLPLVLVAIALAWLIDFALSAMIGLLAFVTEDVAAFEWIYSKVLFLLGGLLIPLDFFPAWLREIALRLPFAYTVYGPARLFVDPTVERFALLLAGQLVWLGLAGGVLALLYRRGVRWLSINGG